MKNILNKVLLLSVMVLFLFANIHSTSAANLEITKIDLLSHPVITAYVTITDQEGKTIKGLRGDNFALDEDDTKISNFSAISVFNEKGGVYIALAIDISGSMKYDNAISQAKKAAKNFISQMSISDQIAIYTFYTYIEEKQPFTNDQSKLIAALAPLKAQMRDREGRTSMTHLYDGIFEGLKALETLGDKIKGRKMLIVLTDGKDEGSSINLKDCADKANKLGVPIYAIGLGGRVQEKPLKRITMLTNGKYLFAPHPLNLLSVYQQIADELENEYLLSYKTTLSKEDISLHNLSLRVDYKGIAITGSKQFQIKPEPKPDYILYVIIGGGILAILILWLAIILIIKHRKKPVLAVSEQPISQIPEKPFIETPTLAEESPAEETQIFAPSAEETVILGKETMREAWLMMKKGTHRGKEFKLSPSGKTTIGRAGDNNIVLDDEAVSRKHAVIIVKDNEFILTDLGSTNHTFVNQNVIMEHKLKDGDEVAIGNSILVFKKI